MSLDKNIYGYEHLVENDLMFEDLEIDNLLAQVRQLDIRFKNKNESNFSHNDKVDRLYQAILESIEEVK